MQSVRLIALRGLIVGFDRAEPLMTMATDTMIAIASSSLAIAMGFLKIVAIMVAVPCCIILLDMLARAVCGQVAKDTPRKSYRVDGMVFDSDELTDGRLPECEPECIFCELASHLEMLQKIEKTPGA
jgi:hypothetical protein